MCARSVNTWPTNFLYIHSCARCFRATEYEKKGLVINHCVHSQQYPFDAAMVLKDTTLPTKTSTKQQVSKKNNFATKCKTHMCKSQCIVEFGVTLLKQRLYSSCSRWDTSDGCRDNCWHSFYHLLWYSFWTRKNFFKKMWTIVRTIRLSFTTE